MEPTEILIKTAHDIGVPQDQLERFLQFQYVPLPWQLKFHATARECDVKDGPVDIGCGGARGPGKSHGVFGQVSLDDCQRYAGLKFLFLRQTGKAASESFEDLIYRVLSRRIEYKYSKGSLLTFTNGSRIVLGGFETENDIDKYIGIEYDGMAVEELNQLTKVKIDKLKGSLRTSRTDGWRPRMYTSFNPGGKGHTFVKETYVIPNREGKESKTRFIPSTYLDNPYLNVEYREYLEELGGNLGRAWREGDFDLFEGQYFAEWRHNKHVVIPFTLPPNWVRLRSIDPSGKSGITSCHWYAVDNDGTVWVYREHYSTGLDSEDHAKEIARLSEGETYKYTVMDTASFSKLGLPETQAELYIRNGVNGLVPASKKRVIGWDVVHSYLKWDEFTEPKLKVFSTCPNMIRTIPELIHDDLHPEDVDTDGEDHCFVGDTLVDTIFGKRKIKDLVGKEQYINTTDGFKKCRSVRKTRVTTVLEATLNNGKTIKATSEHKFLTNKGWKPLKDITDEELICIKPYLTQFKNLITRDFIYVADTFKRKVLDFIVSFGVILTEVFQKVFMFITKITTRAIMILPIWNLNQNLNTFLCIQTPQNLKNKQELISKRLKLKLQNGIRLIKESNGIVFMQKNFGQNLIQLKKNVSYAVKNIKGFLKLQNTVIKIVKLQHFEEEEVYDLTVPFVHNFTIEGGIVVHNCADELRYVLQTLRNQKNTKPLNIVERRIEEILLAKNKSGDFSFNYKK